MGQGCYLTGEGEEGALISTVEVNEGAGVKGPGRGRKQSCSTGSIHGPVRAERGSQRDCRRVPSRRGQGPGRGRGRPVGITPRLVNGQTNAIKRDMQFMKKPHYPVKRQPTVFSFGPRISELAALPADTDPSQEVGPLMCRE